jgi:hypothetical protein
VTILDLAGLPRGWEFEFLYRRHLRARRPAAEPFAQVLHRPQGSVRNHFDGPVRQIACNATDAQALRLQPSAMAEIHALHFAGDEKPACYLPANTRRSCAPPFGPRGVQFGRTAELVGLRPS